MRPWEFQLSTRIHFGRGLLRKLGELTAPLGKSALLVGYRAPGRLQDSYDRAAAVLKKSGVAVARFAEVEPEPDARLVAQGVEALRLSGATVVIGLGGGSVIDVAKAIALVAASGGEVSEYFLGNPAARPLTAALPLVAVPTTAGTGSEVSDIAVLKNKGKNKGVGSLCWEVEQRLPIPLFVYGLAIRPQLAVVDSDLAVGSPPALTAACGADALGHAIEACVSRRCGPLATLLGGQAVALLSKHLPQAVAQPDDPQPREPLALAATLAGMAFTASSVVAAHAVAQALGVFFDLPHGELVAIATPPVLRYNLPACIEPYCQLAAGCGLTAANPEALAERFVEHISDLLCRLGLPDSVQAPADAPADLTDRLVQSVLQGARGPITLNPCRLDEAALAALFSAIVRRTNGSAP
jgi:alcohol dehydrogenase class IV